MTKFYYVSDLHLEINSDLPTLNFINPDPEGILLVAGDVYVSALIDGNHKMSEDVDKRLFIKFLYWAAGFKRAYFVMGNHEFYKSEFKAAKQKFVDTLKIVDKSKLVLLDDSSVLIGDNTVLIGATLWTDMDNDDPLAHMQVGAGMNDFRVILNGNDLFSTEQAVKLHKKSKKYIRKVATSYPDKKVVVVTHHAPSYKSNGKKYDRSIISPGYCSNLEDLIEECPNIVTWVHGHTHVNVDYLIAQCRVLTNQMGYGYGYYTDSSAVEFLNSTTQPKCFEL